VFPVRACIGCGARKCAKRAGGQPVPGIGFVRRFAQIDGAPQARSMQGSSTSAMAIASECRILVVDDEQAVRSALAELLGSAGYAVDTAANVADAIRRLRSRHPQVVVADPELPGSHECEIVSSIRNVASDVPMVLMTRREADWAVGARLGADCLVSKPVDVNVLIRAIEGVRAARPH
jgi:CheY-like chemotaxis protein